MLLIGKEFVLERLTKLRTEMKKNNYDILIIQSTDNYLNEYISIEENGRAYLSNFTGSTGDMILTHKEAYLVVDGRYHTQAEIEVPNKLIHVVKLSFGESPRHVMLKILFEEANKVQHPAKIGFDSKKMPYDFYLMLKEKITNINGLLIDMGSLLENCLNLLVNKDQSINIDFIDASITGKSSFDKLIDVQNYLKKHNIDYFLITSLDEIAYLYNIRSYSIPFNSTIKSLSLIGQFSNYLFIKYENIINYLRTQLGDLVQIEHEDNFVKVFSSLISKDNDHKIRVGFDKLRTPTYRVFDLDKIIRNGDQYVEFESPITALKMIKTLSEMTYIISCFKKADQVINEAINWLNTEINSYKTLTEKDFYNKVKELFYSKGAKALSFDVITASNENSAIIHYTNPDPEKILYPGELMLLDTGAYFEGGYATDLTRTFLIGGDSVKATSKQKEIYTMVLKSAIHGMKAIFPIGTTASNLDTITRSVLWEYGYTYNHGTGHGVGICVHESPPRLNGKSNDVLKENMIFSIEPGIYIEGYGGVRIENLVTIKKIPDKDGWLQVIPLTYAPLDENLIEYSLLNKIEITWLKNYQTKSHDILSQ